MNVNPNLLALLVAAIWGIAPIFEKLSLQSLSPIYVLFVRFILVTSLFIPIFISSNEALNLDQLTLKNLMLILIPGVLAIIGIYLYFTALSGSSASKIVPLTAIYPLSVSYTHLTLPTNREV
mgnify:CR=1 FL=1